VLVSLGDCAHLGLEIKNYIEFDGKGTRALTRLFIEINRNAAKKKVNLHHLHPIHPHPSLDRLRHHLPTSYQHHATVQWEVSLVHTPPTHGPVGAGVLLSIFQVMMQQLIAWMVINRELCIASHFKRLKKNNINVLGLNPCVVLF
jgi:hypothetical protein